MQKDWHEKEQQYQNLKRENGKKDETIMKLEKKIELGKKMRKKANTQIANLKKRVEKSKPTSNGTIQWTSVWRSISQAATSAGYIKMMDSLIT